VRQPLVQAAAGMTASTGETLGVQAAPPIALAPAVALAASARYARGGAMDETLYRGEQCVVAERLTQEL